MLQQKPSTQLPETHWWLPVASMVSEAQTRAALDAFLDAHTPVPSLAVQ